MNILLIGLGSIARKHILAIRSLRPDARIYALRSGVGTESVEGVINIRSVEEMIAPPECVLICNPTARHFDSIESSLALGVPLFIEKPVFDRLDEGQHLVDRCKAAGVRTYVACNLRFHPCIRFLKDYLERPDGRINEVNVYCGSYLPDWRKGRNFRDVYSALPEMGGGVHLDLIHELDYTCWLLGFPLEVRTWLRNDSSLGIAAMDFAHYILWYGQFTVNVNLNYFRRDAKREIELVLDEGTLKADLLRNTVALGAEVLFQYAPDADYTYTEQMKYFLDALGNGAQMMNDIEEAFNILKILLK